MKTVNRLNFFEKEVGRCCSSKNEYHFITADVSNQRHRNSLKIPRPTRIRCLEEFDTHRKHELIVKTIV